MTEHADRDRRRFLGRAGAVAGAARIAPHILTRTKAADQSGGCVNRDQNLVVDPSAESFSGNADAEERPAAGHRDPEPVLVPRVTPGRDMRHQFAMGLVLVPRVTPGRDMRHQFGGRIGLGGDGPPDASPSRRTGPLEARCTTL